MSLGPCGVVTLKSYWAMHCFVMFVSLFYLQYSFSNSGVSTIQILFWRQSLYIIVYDLIKNIVKN